MHKASQYASDHNYVQAIMAYFGLDSTVRPSFAFYKSKAEVDVLVETMCGIGR
ncbi:MAG: hypothetical protein R8K20_02970 [Gallionellaceae bacterium]